jgi:transcriptional regulator
MYRPTPFQEDDADKLVAFMQANSFAMLVSSVEGVPCASHIPLIVAADTDGIKLSGHVAKQNTQWLAFAAAESLAIFLGPHAYISPALYENPESVPTWNYIAVHAYGTPKIITRQDSPTLMDKMIGDMVKAYEASYQAHWESLSDRYREGMMNGVIGFEMVVTRLEGKYKLSQNKSDADQRAVSDSLLQSADPIGRDVGAAMRQNLEPGQ